MELATIHPHAADQASLHGKRKGIALKYGFIITFFALLLLQPGCGSGHSNNPRELPLLYQFGTDRYLTLIAPAPNGVVYVNTDKGDIRKYADRGKTLVRDKIPLPTGFTSAFLGGFSTAAQRLYVDLGPDPTPTDPFSRPAVDVIAAFDTNGNLLFTFKRQDENFIDAGFTSLVVADNGSVYGMEFVGNISKFDADGKEIGALGVWGGTFRPTITSDKSGNIYAATEVATPYRGTNSGFPGGYNAVVGVYSPEGKPLRTIYTWRECYSSSLAIAVDNNGNIFLGNMRGSIVEEFDPYGRLIGHIPSHIRGQVTGLAVDDSGYLYVSTAPLNYVPDTSNPGVYVFKTTR